MSILSMGARIISRSSPVLLIASGAALVLTMPVLRRGLRTALVTATKGALIISDGVGNLTEKIKAETSDIVEEARHKRCSGCPVARIKSLRSSAKVKGRRLAVAATAGVLTVKETAKSVRDDFKGIVDEARQLREERETDSDTLQEQDVGETDTSLQPDGLEAAHVDVDQPLPRKRRPARKKED